MAILTKTKRVLTGLRRSGLTGGLVLAAGLALTCAIRPGSASPQGDAGPPPAPVEDDMHEFMEYVFEPSYKRLKASLADEPADRSAWKGIKADSLILAEAANLLLHRGPAEEAGKWASHSVAVRQQGGALYRAAKMRDYTQAKRQFATLLKKCNQCHDDFAGGEHQLSP